MDFDAAPRNGANPMIFTDTELWATLPLTDDARTFCVILFPAHFEDRIEAVLDGVGAPGYSRAPDVTGRGERGRHFNNAVWPGATGEIFAVLDDACAERLVRQLTALSASLDAESPGLYG